MQKNTKKTLIGYFGTVFLIVTCVSIGILYFNDRSVINREQLTFESPTGVTLKGFYYPGNLDAGVMLLEGFSADQFMLKGFALEFWKLGFHVLTFDFTGHGLSFGSIGFDNAATDVLAKQVLKAEEIFKSESGLLDSQILYMGHSMGSRVALQAATMDDSLAGLILVGTSINLDLNLQSDFFTGVRDSDLEWIQNLNGTNPETPVLLMSGAWDDILTPSAANLLFEQLGGEGAPNARELIIFDYMFHNYEVYSPRVISYALNWAINTLGLGLNPLSPSTMVIRKIFWAVGVSSLFLTLIFFNLYLELKNVGFDKLMNSDPSINITNTQKFLWVKLALWILSLPLCVIVAGVLSLIPIGIPVFNMIYVGFIAGYGIFMVLIYQFRKKKLIPGLEGTFDLKDMKHTSVKKILKGTCIVLGLLILSTLFARSGLYALFPLNYRLIWLILFTLITIPAFYITLKEQEWIVKTKRKRLVSFVHTVIGYVPFILLTILYLVLRSISGMIGAIHGLIIIALVTITGNLLGKIVQNQLFISIIQSFLLYYLVLPQTALFVFF
ncbi:MAG: alpha/beta fold hydrolase [Candidatus Lokiarchaeota archaeon]|nr:alpha/beta fold hydrolase [Candidatus Lokiarchaeota archaeon]